MSTETKNYSQITFEFNDAPAAQDTLPSVGVRVKSFKANEPVEAEAPVEVEVPVPAHVPVQINTSPVVIHPSGSMPEKTPAKKSTRGRKSLKALDAEIGLVNIPADEILFQKQYYSIGEVAEMFRVNQSLLRFWENEFDIIQPRKNRKGDRHFRPTDIKNLELIYDLLRRRKLTIEGAKNFLKKNRQVKDNFEMIQSLQAVKGFLLEIKATL